MEPDTRTMLLASIDHTLATVRAALAAAADPEQLDEARTELAGRAGADVARLVVSSQSPGWGSVPQDLSAGIARAGEAADEGDLRRAEQELAAARERLGGRSR